MLSRVCDARGALGVDVRILEEPEQELRAQVSRDRPVNQRLRDFAVSHRLKERLVAVWVWKLRVDAGFEREARGLGLVGRDVVQTLKLRDAVVVRSDEAVEAPLLPQHFAE